MVFGLLLAARKERSKLGMRAARSPTLAAVIRSVTAFLFDSDSTTWDHFVTYRYIRKGYPLKPGYPLNERCTTRQADSMNENIQVRQPFNHRGVAQR